MSTSTGAFPPLASLRLGIDIAADWTHFKSEWYDYEIVADFTEAADKKQAAVFLASVGSTAHNVFRTFRFADDVDIIIITNRQNKGSVRKALYWRG